MFHQRLILSFILHVKPLIYWAMGDFCSIQTRAILPAVSYTHLDKASLYNTPPCFAIYVAGKVFKHLLDMGGIKAVEKVNLRKAEKLYNFIDNSKLFKCPVAEEDRSIMKMCIRDRCLNVFVKDVSQCR